MVKIWAKIYRDKKIVRDMVYKREGEAFHAENLFSYLTEICESFDIPVPVILESHVENFRQFNNVRITRAHFVERVDFDLIQLEFFE